MDKKLASKLLVEELTQFKDKGYAEISELIGDPVILARRGPSGEEFQLEILFMWDDPRKPCGNLRVIGAIDDGTFPSAFMPLTIDFIMAPDGSLVGG